MSGYTFSELLNVFLYVQRGAETTQESLAAEIGVSKTTIGNWITGKYGPRNRELVEKLANALSLTDLQADLLYYSVSPDWVKYGTPRRVLESMDLFRRIERPVADLPNRTLSSPPRPDEIRGTWTLHFSDDFESNYQRWGVGVKSTNLAVIKRKMIGGRYRLTVRNNFHETVFYGGDSPCFSPGAYFCSVDAQMLTSGANDGYGVFFEEISDDSHVIFRIRDAEQLVSIISIDYPRADWAIHVNRLAIPFLRPGRTNTLGVLANGNRHWFFVNDQLVSQLTLSRLPRARIDIGVISDTAHVTTCEFSHFRVWVPPPGPTAFPEAQQR